VFSKSNQLVPGALRTPKNLPLNTFQRRQIAKAISSACSNPLIVQKTEVDLLTGSKFGTERFDLL
jgi:hypothetical protein